MKTRIKILSILIPGMFTLVSLILFSCGGGNKGGEQSSGNQESSAAVIDTKAKSDDKGVGRFTSVTLGALDNSMADKGKAVFTSKCAACHKTTEVKFVGPGLKGVTERRTPEFIMNMITNPQEMTKNDPLAKKLLEEHLTQMTFQNVSDDEARQLLEYFRQNDGAK